MTSQRVTTAPPAGHTGHRLFRLISSDCSSLITHVALFVSELKGVSQQLQTCCQTPGSRLIRPVRAEFLAGWMINVTLPPLRRKTKEHDCSWEGAREKTLTARCFFNYTLIRAKKKVQKKCFGIGLLRDGGLTLWMIPALWMYCGHRYEKVSNNSCISIWVFNQKKVTKLKFWLSAAQILFAFLFLR